MNAKLRFVAFAAASALVIVPVEAQDAPKQLTLEQANQLAKTLRPQHGKIALSVAHASLDLANSYDFYGPEDTRKILVDIWGNPPSSAEGVLGMVIPAGVTPVSDTWGAIVTYENTGYVADDDAASTDYTELLQQLKQGTEDANAQRKEQGYPAMHVQGWAENPHYDKGSHSVVWARDIQFEGGKVDTLNYDVRSLGRGGVLSINFLSVMPELAPIKSAAGTFASHVSFDDGFRYQDFDANVDKKAEYGIGGLIAAGVGVVAVKKLGLLALLLKFIKPIIFAVVAGFAAFRRRVASLFGRGPAIDE